jgi:hypothetical protein
MRHLSIERKDYNATAVRNWGTAFKISLRTSKLRISNQLYILRKEKMLAPGVKIQSKTFQVL